ncbi:MAG: class I SAM-dependent methyltransferase [Candidatus Cloacimonadaceae bacterium]
MFDRFSQSGTWIDYDTDKEIKKKANRISELIPAEVKTILDVGCGNGIITNLLAEKWDVTGLDSSREALEHVKAEKVLSSATELPFDDNSFDLVMSSEMLEHLNDSYLAKAIAEIIRVDRKYILITVPNSEYLPLSQTKCPKCSTVFHAWHHLQSFTKSRLTSMFMAHFRLVHYETSGARQKQWIPFLLKLKHSLGQWMHPGATGVCPACGNTDFPKSKKNILTKAVNFLNLVLSGRKPYWQMFLFEKKQ